MRGARARWAVALRIARRSALTSWGRSLLIVVLIAVPIMGLAAAAVLLPSTQSTLAERIEGNLGHAQAKLTVVGGPRDGVQQGVEGGYDYSTRGGMEGNAQTEAIDPRTVLPADTRVIAIGGASATFRTPNGEIALAVTTGPSWDRALDGGPYVLLSGRRPNGADEVLLSPAALARLGASVGGTVEMVTPAVRTLTVVGTSRDRSQPTSAQTVFAAARLLPSSSNSAESFVYYVPSTPIDWATVERLNAVGTTAFSRQVVLNPPQLDFTDSTGDGNASLIAVIAIALVFALLEVALLAGSAFLVGARLQQRTLAVISSVGADGSVLQRIVTANGVVLGAVGGAIGLGLGIVGAVVLMRLTDDGTWMQYPGLHLVWPLLAGIAIFGVVVGWIASLVPARAASGFDVVRALRGARSPQRIGRRPVVGIALLTAGIVATLLGGVVLYGTIQAGAGYGDPNQIAAVGLLAGGPVLAQLGAVLCSGLVLRGTARVLARAPLPARLAARDTSRNLGRSVPAVASVMTTVFVAAFVMCIANGVSISNAASHTWQAARIGDAVSTVLTGSAEAPTEADAERQVEVLRRDLPVRSVATVSVSQQAPSDSISDRSRDAIATIRTIHNSDCDPEQQRLPADLRCGPFSSVGGGATWLTVGTSTSLAMVLGHEPSAAAIEMLARGGAVALRSDLAPRGVATLDWFTPKQWDNMDTETPRRTTTLPAVVELPDHPLQDALFVTPSTAHRLGMPATPDRAILTFSRPPTQAEFDSASTAVSALANSPGITGLTVETGPQDFGSQIAWWILLACLVIAISAGATAIGLARIDGCADDLTLASLGAAPRIRKTVAFVQALIVCGLGALVGTALGLLPAVALGAATTSLPFSPPILQLALTAIGIPVVIAAGSWLLVGIRRGDLTRRTAIA